MDPARPVRRAVGLLAIVPPVSSSVQAAIRAGWFHLDYGRLLLLLLLLALFIGGREVDVWLLVAAGLWGVGRLCVAAAFPLLRLQLRLTRPAVFAHEWVRAEGHISNPTWWPLPWVEVETRQPEALAGGLRRVEWLPGGAVRPLTVSWFAERRGVYRLGRLCLRGGDWFGLQRTEREVSPFRELVVYPAARMLQVAADLRRLPEGPRRDPISPFLDDVPAGVRPYRTGDAQRDIAWRATAHRGTLQVRELPPVRERTTCILVDLDHSAWFPPTKDARVEEAISLAASLLCDARLSTRPLALGTWAALRTYDGAGSAHDLPPRALWLAPRGGEPGRRALLRLLAAVHPGEAPSFSEMLRAFGPKVPWGAQSLWVLARDTPAIHALAASWQSRGHPVTLLCLERREGARAQRIGGHTLRVWEVRRDGDFIFR